MIYSRRQVLFVDNFNHSSTQISAFLNIRCLPLNVKTPSKPTSNLWEKTQSCVRLDEDRKVCVCMYSRGGGGGWERCKKLTWLVLGRIVYNPITHWPYPCFRMELKKIWIWWKFNWSNVREILGTVHLPKKIHTPGPVLFFLQILAYQIRS